MKCSVCGGPLAAATIDCVEDTHSQERFEIRRCSTCGLGHTSPRPDDVASYYEPTYHGGRHGITDAWCVRRRLRFVAAVVRPRPGDRLLDVGCGEGSFLLAARDAGWQVAGVELSPRLARERGLDVRASLADAGDLRPLRCATLWHSLEHLTEPVEALARVAGLVEPDGFVFVAVPDAEGWQAGAFGARWAHLDMPRHLHHFGKPSLERALRAAGLEPETWWHQELEYDLFGIVQSASNALLPVSNVFTNRITGRPTGVGRAAEIGALALGVGLTALALPLVPLASAAGRGGTLVVAARRAGRIDERGSLPLGPNP